MINTDLLTGISEIQGNTALGNCYPNPFTGETNIPFTLQGAGYVMLTIIDIRGNTQKSICSGTLPAGKHSLRWDGTGNEGNRLPSGIYFYRLTTEKQTIVKRMVLIR
jgi:flagellar hook assembly protein FlgD